MSQDARNFKRVIQIEISGRSRGFSDSPTFAEGSFVDPIVMMARVIKERAGSTNRSVKVKIVVDGKEI